MMPGSRFATSMRSPPPPGRASSEECWSHCSPGRGWRWRVGSGEPHFSFAGLKSAVQRAVASGQFKPEDIAASFQRALVDCLVDRTRLALEKSDAPALVVAGGVAANQAIRAALADLAQAHGRRFGVPPAWLCTDNAAMIAWAGAERLAAGDTDPLDVPARARWPLDEGAEKVRGAGAKA